MVTVYAKRHDGGISFYDCGSRREAEVLAQALRKCPDVSLVVIEPEERRKAG